MVDRINKALICIGSKVDGDTRTTHAGSCDFDIQFYLTICTVGISSRVILCIIDRNCYDLRLRGQVQSTEVLLQILLLIATTQLYQSDTLSTTIKVSGEVVEASDLCR